MAPDINSLSLRQLVALYNRHAAKPVKTFSTKPTAIRRVAAVLPRQPGRSTKAPRQGRTAQVAENTEKALAALREGCTVARLAAALGGSERAARTSIDRLRRAGSKVKNTGPSTFRLL